VARTTGLVLSGGAGRRVEGRDKGLIPWRGRPLVGYVVETLRPQVERLLLSCNRNLESYRCFDAELVTDFRDDYQGPLAGLEAATPLVASEFLVVVACDTPCLPFDLVERLLQPLDLGGTDHPQVSYANDGKRDHYLCAALRASCLGTLPAYLDQGHRTVRHWYRELGCVAVDFSDCEECFRNLNHLD